jgi:putative ABC transport system permease protein
VVGQFWISICLIIGTLVIYRQLNYIRTREVGFDRDQVLLIKNAFAAGDPVVTFKKEIKQIAGITDATLSGDIPSEGNTYSQNGWFRDPSLNAKAVVVLTNMYVDEDYIPTLGMKMAQGRNFDPRSFPTDSTGIIINQAAAELLGWKEPLNEKFYRPNSRDSTGKLTSQSYHVIGVVKDFNYNSMHEKVLPMIMQLTDSRGILAIRFQGGNIPSLVHQLEKRWDKMANGVPLPIPSWTTISMHSIRPISKPARSSSPLPFSRSS